VSETYHLTSIDIYQLSIVHLATKSNTSTTRYMWKGTNMQPITPSYKNPTHCAQATHAWKVKQDYMQTITPSYKNPTCCAQATHA
jgi:hypothetical protein